MFGAMGTSLTENLVKNINPAYQPISTNRPITITTEAKSLVNSSDTIV